MELVPGKVYFRRKSDGRIYGYTPQLANGNFPHLVRFVAEGKPDDGEKEVADADAAAAAEAAKKDAVAEAFKTAGVVKLVTPTSPAE